MLRRSKSLWSPESGPYNEKLHWKSNGPNLLLIKYMRELRKSMREFVKENFLSIHKANKWRKNGNFMARYR